jgi:hypothetical protein
MGTGVKDKEDIIPRLLLKVYIPPAFAPCIATLHFNRASVETDPKTLYPRRIFPEYRSGDYGCRNTVRQMDE